MQSFDSQVPEVSRSVHGIIVISVDGGTDELLPEGLHLSNRSENRYVYFSFSKIKLISTLGT